MTRALPWIPVCLAVVAVLVAWPDRAAAQDTPTMTETLAELGKITDRACACKDDACHEKVAAEVDAWTKRYDATEVTDAELLTLDISDMADHSMRLATCSEPAAQVLLAWSETDNGPKTDTSPRPGEPAAITGLRAVRDVGCACKDRDQACIDESSRMFIEWAQKHGDDLFDDAYMPVVEQLGYDFGRCSPFAMQAVLEGLR